MNGILGAIGGIIITIFMLPLLTRLWDQGFTQQQERLAADHLNMVTKAAATYVRTNGEALLGSATATSGPSVDISTLINEGLLSQGFSQHNIWGQTYQVYIRRPQANELQAIVLTSDGFTSGKENFATVVVPMAALLAGGSAGFVPTGTVPGQTTGTLHGAGGGWVLTLSSLGIPSPGPGHLGALASFDSSSLGQDFLYRVAVPGHEELNAMQTELDMTDHAIRNVSELQFTEREITDEACTDVDDQGRIFLDKNFGLYVCRNYRLETIGDTGNSTLINEVTLARNGDVITKPVCPTNTGTVPMIFTSPSIAEAGPVAPAISAFQSWAASLSDTEWQVNLRLLTTNKTIGDDDGWVYPPDNYHRIAVFTTCARAVIP
jgi:hypothetical protein